MNKNWYYFLFVLFFLSACEEEYVPGAENYTDDLVLECYIENGNNTIPVYAIVTKAIPFYSTFGIEEVNKAFVHDAKVEIEWEGNRVRLQEFCLQDLPEAIRLQILDQFGLDPDSVKTNFCAYIDINNEITKEAGKQYNIHVVAGQDSAYASGIMPAFNVLDSLWFDKPAGKPSDSFAQLFIIINDPPIIPNFYRYFTGTQNENVIPNQNSVIDDNVFDGKKFKTSLAKAAEVGEDFNENSGLFRKGDTAKIQWCSITQEEFYFWTTLETSRVRQGPFASYVRIKGNVKGALGIFGLQSCKYYEIPVPK